VTKAPKHAPAAAPSGNATPRDWKRLAISAFLLFHLIAIASWALPLNSLLNDQVRSVVRPYMLWSGLFQAWGMFAPDPMNQNIYVDAEVTFRDGSTRLLPFPRMQELGYVDRYFKERYRKFVTEYLRLDSHSALWPDAARFVARANRNPSNPPVSVRLIRSWTDIPAPSGRDWEYRPYPPKSFTFFTYQPTPGDLE
jgi:hypothetical protein